MSHLFEDFEKCNRRNLALIEDIRAGWTSARLFVLEGKVADLEKKVSQIISQISRQPTWVDFFVGTVLDIFMGPVLGHLLEGGVSLLTKRMINAQNDTMIGLELALAKRGKFPQTFSFLDQTNAKSVDPSSFLKALNSNAKRLEKMFSDLDRKEIAIGRWKRFGSLGGVLNDTAALAVPATFKNFKNWQAQHRKKTSETEIASSSKAPITFDSIERKLTEQKHTIEACLRANESSFRIIADASSPDAKQLLENLYRFTRFRMDFDSGNYLNDLYFYLKCLAVILTFGDPTGWWTSNVVAPEYLPYRGSARTLEKMEPPPHLLSDIGGTLRVDILGTSLIGKLLEQEVTIGCLARAPVVGRILVGDYFARLVFSASPIQIYPGFKGPDSYNIMKVPRPLFDPGTPYVGVERKIQLALIRWIYKHVYEPLTEGAASIDQAINVKN